MRLTRVLRKTVASQVNLDRVVGGMNVFLSFLFSFGKDCFHELTNVIVDSIKDLLSFSSAKKKRLSKRKKFLLHPGFIRV